MTEVSKSGVYYQCPNNCSEKTFHQYGNISATRFFTEEGEVIEDDCGDFSPTRSVHCRTCDAEAIVKTKTVRTIVTIE